MTGTAKLPGGGTFEMAVNVSLACIESGKLEVGSKTRPERGGVRVDEGSISMRDRLVSEVRDAAV